MTNREEKIMMNELAGMSRRQAEIEADTRTFKNKHFKQRDYEVTNRVFCRAINEPSSDWVETSEEIPSSMMQLGIDNDVRYFGYL